MIVQKVYMGWVFFGIAILAALIFTAWHTVQAWREPTARWLSLLSFVSVVATQLIFWAYTYPMNALTRNWTVMPANLEAARRQWEYSHAVNAGLTLLALVLIVAAVLAGSKQNAAGHAVPTAAP
jgi:hypothetical protein